MPTLRLEKVISNAAAIWSAVCAGAMPPAAARLPGPAYLLVWRQGETPCFRSLEVNEASAIEAIQCGATFGDLCAGLVEAHGATVGIRLAGAWLGQWLADGLIASVAESSCAENRPE